MIVDAPPHSPPVAGAAGSEASTGGWHRHPSDVARLVAAALVAVVLVAVEATGAPRLRRLTDDVVTLVGQLPNPLTEFLVGLLQLLATAAPVVALVVLAARQRWRLLGTLLAAGALGATVMAAITTWLSDSRSPSLEANQAVGSWFIGAAYPSGSYVAGLTAVVTAAAPALSRPWRRALWSGVALMALVRLLTATTDPFTLALLVALGSAAGSAVLVAGGAQRRRVDPDVVAETLRRSGIDAVTVDPVETAGTPTFEVLARDGTVAWVTVLGRDDRDTDLLLQAVRWLRVRGLGDARPPGAPRRVAERSVVASSLAAAGGARVPAPLAVAGTAEGATVLAVEDVAGPTLATCEAADLTPEVLADLWRQVERVHARGIAHRGLTARRVVLAETGPTLVRFRGAELEATEQVRDADVAELLVTTALRVGADPAVAAAARVLGPETLGRALPLLQPIVLHAATRAAMADQPDLLAELHRATQDAAGVESLELADLKRIDLKGVVSLVGATVLGYYILSLASDAAAIWESLRQADMALVPWIVALTALQFVGGAFSLMGAVNTRLGLARTVLVMFAQSFLNRFTPANAGGMALRTRYLQKSGIDLPVAASAVGLTSVASGVAQVVVFAVFIAWGDAVVAFDDVSLPSASRILVILVGIGAVVGLVLATTWGRERVRPWIARSAGSAWGNLRELCRQPSKLGLLFGGAVMSKLVSMGAFAVSIQALGVSLPLASVGALYLVATTIGGAVPTPGGVGGVEAALAAALTAVGVEPATAASIVLLFRLINFWLPVVPGYAALRRVQARDIA